jgi:hypothetical protein
VLGDEDGGNLIGFTHPAPLGHGPQLALGSALFGVTRWADAIASVDAVRPWWCGLALPEATGDGAPPPISLTLAEAGYYGASFDDWYCLVDAGPHGGDRTGHAHTDIGHVEVCHGTWPLSADPGSSVYAADPSRRALERSLVAHASVDLGDPLAQPRGPFGWTSWPSPPTVSTPSASEDAWTVALEYGTHGGVTRHFRRVILVRGLGVLVIDQIYGRASPSTVIRWPIPHPPGTVTLGAATAHLPGGHTISWYGSAPLRATLGKAGYSPGYGRLMEGTQIVVELTGAAMPAWIVTLLAAGEPVLLADEHPAGGLEIRIRDPRGTDLRLRASAQGVEGPVPLAHHP